MKLVKKQIGSDYILLLNELGWARQGEKAARANSKRLVRITRLEWVENKKRVITVQAMDGTYSIISVRDFYPLRLEPPITDKELDTCDLATLACLEAFHHKTIYHIRDKVVLPNAEGLKKTARGLVQRVAMIEKDEMFVEQTLLRADGIVEHSMFLVEPDDEIVNLGAD